MRDLLWGTLFAHQQMHVISLHSHDTAILMLVRVQGICGTSNYQHLFR
jgi:hypothetical protein